MLIKLGAYFYKKNIDCLSSPWYTFQQDRDEAMEQPGYIRGETLINHDEPREILVISLGQIRFIPKES